MMRDYGFFDYGFVFNEEVLKVFYYFNRDALKNEFGIEKYEDLSADDIISIIWDDLVVFAPAGSYEVNYLLRSENCIEYLEDSFVYTPLRRFPGLTTKAYKNDREYIEEITNELKDYFPEGFDFSKHIASIIGSYCG